uniref:protein-tyrosine-phosphatase n=1 Tax=Hucho hucho TaxID=62062 RepID=A0A4W5MTW2_9TELE
MIAYFTHVFFSFCKKSSEVPVIIYYSPTLPAAFRKKLVGGCLPCTPLSSSAPLRALQSCVSGCNPKASQGGSSTCSYCSSDPIVVTFNPHRGGKPPRMGRGIVAGHPMGVFPADDDDYSVRTIWPEELAKKMTSSNGTSPVILDCKNLLEFTRNQITDHAGRRRLQQGKMAVLDFIGSGSGPGTLLKPKPRQRDAEGRHSLPSAQSLHLVLNSVNRDDPNQMKLSFLTAISHCVVLSSPIPVHLTLPLSSSLPASLSDESGMTPDVENAVVSPILPFLFLGNERDAQDLDLLLRLNIGYVVNVTTHLPLYHLGSGLIRYKRLPATDNSKQNLRQYFEEVFEFIEEAHQSGRGVLVHCQAGVSRSATIVIAYLMKHTLMTMTDAYKYVRGRRPVVSPNLNFMGQLLEFERDLNSGVTPRILTPKLSGLETQV